MNSKELRIFMVLATVVFLSGLGYLAWQTRSTMRALEQMSSAKQVPPTDITNSLKQTQDEIRRLGSNVRLPSVDEWVRAIEKPLAAKVDSLLAPAQKRAVEEAMQKWSEGVRQREEKRWSALMEEFRQGREEARKQLQEVLAALRRERELVEKRYQQEREAAAKRQQQDEERWQKLLTTVRQEREEGRKQYREIVRKLDEERAGALERARQLEEEREREIAKRLKQAEQIELERKRLMREFCAQRPDSAICRDL